MQETTGGSRSLAQAPSKLLQLQHQSRYTRSSVRACTHEICAVRPSCQLHAHAQRSALPMALLQQYSMPGPPSVMLIQHPVTISAQHGSAWASQCWAHLDKQTAVQAAEGSSAAPIAIPEAEPISPSRRSTRVRKPGPRSPILLVGEPCTVHGGWVVFCVCTRACGMRLHADIHAVLHVVLGLKAWAKSILI